MTASDPGQVLAYQRVDEREGRMVVELHFPVEAERQPTGPVPLPRQAVEAPMLMLWNGEMEVGPLTLTAFRRGIALGSITEITHVRTIPSYDWIEMKHFSGSGFATENAVTYIQKESRLDFEDTGGSEYFYPPLSPYRWLRGLSIAWAVLSLFGLLLPGSWSFWAFVSALSALGLAALSMVLNRRPSDLVVPFVCMGFLAAWTYLEPAREASPVIVQQVPAMVREEAVIPAAAEKAYTQQQNQASLADLPKLEPLRLP